MIKPLITIQYIIHEGISCDYKIITPLTSVNMKRIFFSALMLLVSTSALLSQQVTFKVNTPGTLSSMIAESKKYTITNMKIVGEINSDDMCFIREMAGVMRTSSDSRYTVDMWWTFNKYYMYRSDFANLEELDLSEASFAEGGDGYVYYNNRISENRYGVGYAKLEPGVINVAQFAQCWSLKKIVLPDNISEIRDAAFYGCINLETIEMSTKYLRKLGKEVFFNTSLKQFSLGAYADNVTFRCFDGARGLEQIEVSEDNESLCSIDGALYSKDGSKLLLCPAGRKGVFAVAESATVIDTCAFAGCADLTLIMLPASVKVLKEHVFYTFDYKARLSRICQPASIYSYSELPPECDEDAFYYLTQNTAQTILYVPRDCKTVYEYAKGWGDFMVIEEFSVSPCPKPTISYSNGSLHFHCDVEGAEFVTDITDADVKTHHGSSIQLTGTYNISVYATAPGYDQSEIVTATLSWIEFEPSMDGAIDNEDAVTEVKAKPVLIQAESNIISIQGAVEGADISVYSLDGIKQGSAVAKNGITTISTNLQSGSAVIVKIGSKAVKGLIK